MIFAPPFARAALRLTGALSVSIAALAATSAACAAEPILTLTPAPAQATLGQGTFALTARTRIFVAKGDVEARVVAGQLSDMLLKARGLKPAVVEGAPPAGEAAIVLARGSAQNGKAEAYALQVAPTGVMITAAKRTGLFYGAVSVWQLAVQDAAKGPVQLPAVAIDDSPRFAWRGFMLDSARHFQSVETIKAILDAMAAHKLNVLHWHLVDDQGWRLEIKKYPKLTREGAWRVPAGAAGRDPRTGKAVRYQGFYTQDQVRDLVAYAAARGITIVPEIEMPGHALAPLAAYPQFGMTKAPPRQAMGDWGVFPYLYRPSEATFTFLNDVLDEVMDLFPSEYIHVGGDEAVKDQWKASPEVQAQIQALGVKDEHGLQSWFIQRAEKHINARGRRMIGWDEILEGGLAPNATVMSWRGIDGAVAAASQGHDAVLAPDSTLYLDRRQSASADEPPGRIKIVSLKDVYDFDAAPTALTEAQRAHILGLQATAFTEHMRTDERLERMTFPRLVAVAENGWTPAARHDWAGFAARLPAETARLDVLGVAHDTVPYEPQATLRPADGGQVAVALASGLGLGEIRYTTDGRAPTRASGLYDAPLALAPGKTVRARTFLGDAALGRIRDYPVSLLAAQTRDSHQLELCSNGINLSLEDDAPKAGSGDGPRAVFAVDLMNPCWVWKGADLSAGLTLTARIGQVPFNFQIGADREKIPLRAPASPAGELEVRIDGCAGERIAAIPLGAAARGPGLGTVSGVLPRREGFHDLCLTFTARTVEPTLVLDQVTLTPTKITK
ncbi:family 20 glycosylhydrolase [Caulobacter sp. UNC279MFTsu5.1]|uniref:family 20 glycosylhydrolase n=1 Tax=Caulobacter sp. UNC279MFTsu5.1 TaxID=1502775 RepID=UPI0008F19346|nr:family 20 glycosylhydrolase [Caulobacter sp. UNC279MFTsu5.1]SFK15661.1 hexosaminidase [Caulobacter sp. UNC279MFTsu5.1]